MAGILLERVAGPAADVCVELYFSPRVSRWTRRAAAPSLPLGLYQLEVCEGVGEVEGIPAELVGDLVDFLR